MADLKQFFDESEDGLLTYEQLMQMMKEAGSKFVDLSTGDYVAKNKYNSELQALNSQIESLNETLNTRDGDLADLKSKLEAAGADGEKIASLTKDLETLQGKYNDDTKAFEDRLRKQSYEFAVREFANEQSFSSQAAKRDFIQTMIADNLKMKDGKIIGVDDFMEAYKKDNGDAFMTEEDFGDYYGNNDEDYDEESESEFRPQFVAPTQGGEPVADAASAFAEAFHFTGVRPAPGEGNNN